MKMTEVYRLVFYWQHLEFVVILVLQRLRYTDRMLAIMIRRT